MKSFKLDENGDLVFENGSFVMIEGNEELAQQARISMQTEKGEWFLDPEEGMDRSPILSKNFNETEAKDIIMESTIGTTEPLEFENITFVRDIRNRKISIDIVMRKEDGEVLELEGVEI
ncbi:MULTISPECIES: hypothetical protein [Peribacillus]|uniref:DUF2634 domain-containing protein n=2 Tax=Peribacillus TaxID=2675229 RepID=A0AAN2TRN2_9BACI|nr:MULTISPECIES: hypothetical protein [Peribacillus]MBD8590261.1 DUF2634 domain-containing protein [Peribacillus simplex]TFH62620.1 DUF2634 domain-containing protein [Peribacillus frigoritolerans]CEG31452.1 hypothetical protein BN1180_01596 [Peribacillus simplex]